MSLKILHSYKCNGCNATYQNEGGIPACWYEIASFHLELTTEGTVTVSPRNDPSQLNRKIHLCTTCCKRALAALNRALAYGIED